MGRRCVCQIHFEQESWHAADYQNDKVQGAAFKVSSVAYAFFYDGYRQCFYLFPTLTVQPGHLSQQFPPAYREISISPQFGTLLIRKLNRKVGLEISCPGSFFVLSWVGVIVVDRQIWLYFQKERKHSVREMPTFFLVCLPDAPGEILVLRWCFAINFNQIMKNRTVAAKCQGVFKSFFPSWKAIWIKNKDNA